MKNYKCNKCGQLHDINSAEGIKHLSYNLSREDVQKLVEFTGTAGSYAYITNNSQQYMRDVQVFEVLKDKFSHRGMFDSPEAAQSWVHERLAVNPDNLDQFLRRLQGDGAGEVDAIRQLNGGLKSILFKTDFVRDTSGNIPSNTPGIDLQTVNRFTGKVVDEIQVKSNWSQDPEVLKQTLSKFVNSDNYSPNVTLAAPQEVIDIAKEMNIPNNLVVVGDTAGNRISGERLLEKIKSRDTSVEGVITLDGVAARVGEGAVIGAAVGLCVSAFGNFMAYRQGRIDGKEAFKNIGVDGSKGAIVGSAMGGLSILFPPGIIGIGIGIAVGMQIRRIIDIAYGKGAYEDMIHMMGGVVSSIKTTEEGIATIAKSISYTEMAQKVTLDELKGFAKMAKSTDSMLDKMDSFKNGGI